MSASKLEELAAFTQFARSRMANDASDTTLEECIQQWREREATVSDVIQGRSDFEAGLFVPVDQAFDEIHRTLGIPK